MYAPSMMFYLIQLDHGSSNAYKHDYTQKFRMHSILSTLMAKKQF